MNTPTAEQVQVSFDEVKLAYGAQFLCPGPLHFKALRPDAYQFVSLGLISHTGALTFEGYHTV